MGIHKKLIRSICLQLLNRGNRPWDGRESHQVVALSHTALNVTTNKEDFRKLVSAVFQVGKVMDFSYEKRTYKTPDWESFRVRISDIAGNLSYSSDFDFFFERLRGGVASYSLEAKARTDWVEMINKILNQHNILLDDFSLESKLKISEVMEEFLLNRIEINASCAAADMGISIEDLHQTLTDSFSKLDQFQTNNKVCKDFYYKDKTGQECFELILSLSDARAMGEISCNLKKYPDQVSKIIVKRWKACKEDILAEKLWSKSIKGTSGLIREMVIFHMGTHYRLLYNTSKNCKNPFLAFGLRRDLFSMVEKSMPLIL